MLWPLFIPVVPVVIARYGSPPNVPAGLTTVTPEVRFVSSTLSDFEANDVVT
jgi:hypothetical protein